MPYNLPDGCTQKDIDDAMEGPREPTCPQCGSHNVEEITKRNWFEIECRYLMCFDCDHQWGHE